MASASCRARWMRSPPLTVSMPVSKATSWAGQAARPLRGSRRSAGELSFHGLMCPARSIRVAPNDAGRRPQKTHLLPQFASTCRANTCCPTRAAAKQDSLGFQIRPHVGVAVLADLVAQGCFEHGDVEFLLAEQRELAALLQAQKVRQPGWADAFGPGGVQQDAVDGAEPGRIFAEHGAGQDIPPAAVGTRAVQVGHFRQHAGRRPREQAGQRRHRLRRAMCGTAAEVAVIHQKRSGEAEQRLDGQERHLPATLNRPTHQQRPELITGLADRHFQVVSHVSHAVRVLPKTASEALLPASSSGAPYRAIR